MEDDLRLDDDFAGLKAKYDWYEFDKFLEASAETLTELDSEQKLKVIGRILNMSNYDHVDLDSLVAYELQNSPNKPTDHTDRVIGIGEGLKNPPPPPPPPLPPVLADYSIHDVVYPLPLDNSKQEKLKSGKSLALKKQPSSSVKQERLLKEKQGKKPMTDDKCMMIMVKKKSGRKVPLPLQWPRTDSPARPPAVLKEKIKQYNGSEEILVIQKRLRRTDLSHNNCRLSMPLSQITPEFTKYLTPEEEAQLNMRIGKDIPGIKAGLIKPSGHESTICLKKWDMIKSPDKNNYTYNLVTGWKEVLLENGNEWREGMTVQVWSFRVDSKLWFAVLQV